MINLALEEVVFTVGSMYITLATVVAKSKVGNGLAIVGIKKSLKVVGSVFFCLFFLFVLFLVGLVFIFALSFTIAFSGAVV